MGKGTLLLAVVCSLFFIEMAQCRFPVKKEAGCKVHTVGGKCCVFPFKYKGKTYKSCTLDSHDKMWCSTTFDFDSDSKWGNCRFEDCQIKTKDGKCCVFPFYFDLFHKYYGCTTKKNDGKAWCGTQKYVFQGRGGWGECAKPCDSSPCKNNGICENVEDSFSCACAKGFEGKTCEEKVNPCDSSPCKNNGTCKSLDDSFSCTCSKGFEGKTCEEKVNPCDSFPCKNNGTCKSVDDTFCCTCAKGFEGKTCEEKVNPCDSSPCKNNGVCKRVDDGFSCTCAKGFEGRACEEKVNPCDSSPCKNNGICKSVEDSFSCKCAKGFEGKTCEEKGCKVYTTTGECCVFPFKYSGKIYENCIDNHHDKVWCSTTSDYDSDHKWGNCKVEGCKVYTTKGECCVFPFQYNGKMYKSCIVENSSQKWCSTTANYDSDSKWGVCRLTKI